MTDQPSISVRGEAIPRPPAADASTARLWQNLTVRLAVALAFADASIVVLALPQIVVRLHTSISHVTWVIMAYNLALIVTAAVVIPFGRRLASAQALIGGLTLFGLASIGCGLANSMAVLIPFRCLQGVGGGLLLCASLPMFAGTARPGDSPLNGWSAAAAIGFAVGPAIGGILTQLFDWRSIFLAQAPVAALAVILVVAVHVRFEHEIDEQTNRRRSLLDPLTANAGLTLLSAGLIAALFLVVLVLILVWGLTPIGAAAVVTTIPLATAIAERAVRGRSPIVLAAVGATLTAGGLLGLSFVTHRELGLVILMLALVGTGLGLAFPGLTTAALATGGPAASRAAKTVAARDAGIVLGLLVLTPVFVNQLNTAPQKAIPAATKAVLTAPVPPALKFSLAPGLIADYKKAPQTQLPNFSPTFAEASAHATPSERVALSNLHNQLDSIVPRAATSAFKLPLRYGAIFALVVLPLLGLGLILSANRRRPAPVP
jgi:predicted MFS family arabinose efflux permease